MRAQHRTSAGAVVRAVCAYYDVRCHRLVSRSRLPEYVEARRVIMVILAEDVGLGASEIGRVVHRDHSTVLHHLGRTDYPSVWSDEAAAALADVRAILAASGTAWGAPWQPQAAGAALQHSRRVVRGLVAAAGAPGEREML